MSIISEGGILRFAPYISIYDFAEASDIQYEVIWTFSSFLNGISSSRQRFNIHIVSAEELEREEIQGSVKSVWRYLSAKDFQLLNKIEQKKVLLELITSSFLKVSKELNWSEEAILEANDKSLQQSICFLYESKPIINKKRNYKANIKLELNKDKVSIWVMFASLDKSKKLKKHMLDVHANQLSFFKVFNSPKWISNSEFGFQFENEIILKVSLEDDMVIWENVNSTKDEYFVNMIDYNSRLTAEEFAKLANG